MPLSPRRHGWHLLRLGVGDELSVAHRIAVDGEFEQSVEKKPSARRALAIEAEDPLVEVIREMSFVEATLMSAREPPLGERGDPVHTREHDVRGLPTALDVDRLVDVAVSDSWRIAGPGVGDERRSLFDVLGDQALRRGRRRVGERSHAAPTESSGFSELGGHADQDLLAPLSAATKPGFLATEVGLVDLNSAGEPVAPGRDEHRAEPVQHRPGRLVGAELKGSLQAPRRDPVLRRRELPAHREPHRERRPAAVEQRACRHGRLPVAAGALEAPPGHEPATRVLAPRADEALRPAQPCEVVEAVGIGWEPRLELSGRTWVMHSTLGTIDHPIRMVGSDGYPLQTISALRPATFSGSCVER